MASLSGKVAIITGASSGIGAHIAISLAALGVKVCISARSQEKLNQVTKQIQSTGGHVTPVVADVSKREDCVNMTKLAMEKYGNIDYLINNAGISYWQYMRNVDQDSWDQMVDINIKGSLNCIAAVLPDMVERREGYIINMSSVRGVTAGAGGAVYSGTKHFIEGMSNGLRQEVSSHGVRVSTIQPTLVQTNLIASNLNNPRDKEAVEERREKMESIANNILQPEDVSDAVVFLLTRPAHAFIPSLPVHAVAQSFK